MELTCCSTNLKVKIKHSSWACSPASSIALIYSRGPAPERRRGDTVHHSASARTHHASPFDKSPSFRATRGTISHAQRLAIRDRSVIPSTARDNLISSQTRRPRPPHPRGGRPMSLPSQRGRAKPKGVAHRPKADISSPFNTSRRPKILRHPGSYAGATRGACLTSISYQPIDLLLSFRVRPQAAWRKLLACNLPCLRPRSPKSGHSQLWAIAAVQHSGNKCRIYNADHEFLCTYATPPRALAYSHLRNFSPASRLRASP